MQQHDRRPLAVQLVPGGQTSHVDVAGNEAGDAHRVTLYHGSALPTTRAQQTAARGVEFPKEVLSVALDRCRGEADLIYRLGVAGEMPYARLLAEGHNEI